MAKDLYGDFNRLIRNTESLISIIETEVITPLETVKGLKDYELLQNVPDVYAALQEVSLKINRITRMISLVDNNLAAFRQLKFSKNTLSLLTDYLKTDSKALVERKESDMFQYRESLIRERDAQDKMYKVYSSILFNVSRYSGESIA